MASKSLYVGNLPYGTTELEIKDLFARRAHVFEHTSEIVRSAMPVGASGEHWKRQFTSVQEQAFAIADCHPEARVLSGRKDLCTFRRT